MHSHEILKQNKWLHNNNGLTVYSISYNQIPQLSGVHARKQKQQRVKKKKKKEQV